MSRIQNKKSKVQHITIDAEHAGRRIDNYITGNFKGLPKSRIYQMLRRGEVRINGKRVKQGTRLQPGDVVRIPPLHVREQQETIPAPEYLLQKVSASVIFEDDSFIGLNKPAGIVVHSGTGRTYGIIELLRILRPDEKGLQLVHRLDRDTSGCLLIVKSMDILRQLHASFKTANIKKQYIALLQGRLPAAAVVVDQALQKNIIRSGERMVAPDNEGKQALTRFKLIRQFEYGCLVNVSIDTGRTHQIRVHAAHLGHPVAGDEKYGDKGFNKDLAKAGLKRMFLHASLLRFPDQSGRKYIELKAPLPHELESFLKQHE